MTPSEIIAGCRRDGIELRLTNDGMLRYSGEKYTLTYWLPILATHKLAVADELSSDPFAPEVEAIQRCRDCKHFAQPGKADGYCGGRQDLPSAYGVNHPLRRLPADGGTTCHAYSPGDWVKP
jgi:hypothetical protein